MRRGSILKVAAVALVGVGAAGVVGYRAVTGHCIFGSCETKAAATVTPVAASTPTEEACPLGCAEKAGEAAVQTVAHETHGADACETATPCEKEVVKSCCQGEAMAEAKDCDPADCEKPDCCGKLATNETAEPAGAPVGG